eukprot:1161191-Pelagomonas_calceolata.AAC.5
MQVGQVEEQKGEEIGVIKMPGEEVPPPAPPPMAQKEQGRQDKRQGERIIPIKASSIRSDLPPAI